MQCGKLKKAMINTNTRDCLLVTISIPHVNAAHITERVTD